MGHHAVGVEPVTSFVEAAREYLGDASAVLQGTAERIPLDDESQHLVFLESVMEHVDSPTQSLQEAHRVLAAGGIAYVVTTNRFLFRPTGKNGEFNARFYNWYPRLVKECYVFHHLHYKPSLANYTERPAVHWYSYSDLCRLGREVGFGQFYSILDLVRPEDAAIAKSRFRRLVLRQLQRFPWLRALALTQLGGTVVMLKRSFGEIGGADESTGD
jgi:ubiquinone/menaquinone biosynthesis C-methylase UbiE